MDLGIGGGFVLRAGVPRHDRRLAPVAASASERSHRTRGSRMITLFVVFWSVMIFASVAWYGFLIFYVGIKGGREIKAMTRAFDRRDEERKE
jgi:hypothetical protein